MVWRDNANEKYKMSPVPRVSTRSEQRHARGISDILGIDNAPVLRAHHVEILVLISALADRFMRCTNSRLSPLGRYCAT